MPDHALPDDLIEIIAEAERLVADAVDADAKAAAAKLAIQGAVQGIVDTAQVSVSKLYAYLKPGQPSPILAILWPTADAPAAPVEAPPVVVAEPVAPGEVPVVAEVPVVEAPVAEPVVEAPVEVVAEVTPVAEPVAELPVGEPEPEPAPVAEAVIEAPVVEPVVEAPVAEVVAAAPTFPAEELAVANVVDPAATSAAAVEPVAADPAADAAANPGDTINNG